MINLYKYKRMAGLLFTVGYLVLLIYSSFHYHKIDVRHYVSINQNNASTGNTNNLNDTVLSSLLTCHFNLIYNSPFENNSQTSVVPSVIDEVEYLPAFIKNSLPRFQTLRGHSLRAPPAVS